MNSKSYDEKIKELKRQYQEAEILKRKLNEQKDRALIAMAQMLPDDVALTCSLLYPEFESVVGQEVEQGFKFTYGEKLHKVIQPKITLQTPPGEGTESLYVVIDEQHAGTAEDPIPFNGNMVLEKDKYYVQDMVVYICIRDTVNPVYNKLSELVGTYVQAV